MKLRVPPRPLSSYSNHYRLILKNTLRTKYRNSLLISSTYLPRRKLWLITPIHSRKWSFNILPIYLSSCGARTILRILHPQGNLKHRSYPIPSYHGHCLHRLCSTLRTNKILRGHSNYQPILSYPLYWKFPS